MEEAGAGRGGAEPEGGLCRAGGWSEFHLEPGGWTLYPREGAVAEAPALAARGGLGSPGPAPLFTWLLPPSPPTVPLLHVSSWSQFPVQTRKVGQLNEAQARPCRGPQAPPDRPTPAILSQRRWVMSGDTSILCPNTSHQPHHTGLWHVLPSSSPADGGPVHLTLLEKGTVPRSHQHHSPGASSLRTTARGGENRGTNRSFGH